jgi:hypothetical protein
MSWFSSDRAIAEYAEEIWDIPIPGKSAEAQNRGQPGFGPSSA